VREPFRLSVQHDRLAPTAALERGGSFIAYTADGPNPSVGGRTRFAREMPRAISRSHLVVRSIRQERLQDLSDADAIACGFADRDAFAINWDAVLKGGKFSISGTKIRWADNPAVNVITFKLVRGPLP